MALPPKIEWTALEYEHRPKPVDWFWALGIIAVAGIVISIIFENYLFALFILIASLSLAYLAHREPEPVDFELNHRGLKIKRYTYPYVQIKAFWVDYNKEQPLLIVHYDRVMMPMMYIPLAEDLDPDLIREFLRQYLPEEEMRESTTHKVMEYFGF